MTDRIVLDLSAEGAVTTDPTKPQTYEALPQNWYKGVVYEATDRKTGPTSKKPGSPFIEARLRVTEGEFAGRQVRDGFIALYRSKPEYDFQTKRAEQLARISGVNDGSDPKAVVLPLAEDILGLEVEFRVKQVPDEYATEQYIDETGEEPEEPLLTNEVTAYRPIGGWPKAGAAKGKAGAKKKPITL